MFKHISSFNELNMVENMLMLPRNMGIVSGSDQHVISFVWGQKFTPGKTEDSNFWSHMSEFNIGMFEHN